MDEMKLKLSTNFMRNFVAKIVHKIIFKKIGYRVGVGIRELDVSYANGKAHIHVNLDMSMDESEFKRLINDFADF